LLLALWPAATVQADEVWKDDIERDTTWTAQRSPYIVTRDITIERDFGLTVDPGVTVKIYPGVVIEVRGRLRAEATAEKPIVFTWDKAGQRWGSITVEGGNARLNQVTISHANVGLLTTGWGFGTTVFSSVFRDNGIGIHIDQISPDFGKDESPKYALIATNNLITKNTIGALFTKGNSRLIGNNISENAEQGIGGFATVEIAENTIWANGTDGIETVTRGGDPDLDIHDNTINFNGFGGLSLREGSYRIQHNNIFGNGRFDIRWLGPEELDARWNFWGTSDTAVLATRILDGNYQSALGTVKEDPLRLALVDNAPAPIGGPPSAPAPAVAAPAPAPAPAAPAPAPVIVRGPRITDPVAAKFGSQFFGETGHNIEGVFLAHFRNSGGLARFGYPRTEAIIENGLLVQWFQRGRMEHHPQHAGTRYEVQLALLGDLLTTVFRPYPIAPVPCETSSECRYFPETQHLVYGAFLKYFEANGSLEAFGFPISERTRELNDDGTGRAYTMQWFQRARFELHPEIGPNVVQHGLLGDEQLKNLGLLDK
jgi:hypothetical protein